MNVSRMLGVECNNCVPSRHPHSACLVLGVSQFAFPQRWLGQRHVIVLAPGRTREPLWPGAPATPKIICLSSASIEIEPSLLFRTEGYWPTECRPNAEQFHSLPTLSCRFRISASSGERRSRGKEKPKRNILHKRTRRSPMDFGLAFGFRKQCGVDSRVPAVQIGHRKASRIQAKLHGEFRQVVDINSSLASLNGCSPRLAHSHLAGQLNL